MSMIPLMFAAMTLTQAPSLEPESPPPELPKEWHGRWKGTLRIELPAGKPMEVPMELNIHPLAERKGYQWQIVYGAGPKMQKQRNYELLLEKGDRFVIDEKNGITLNGARFGNVLTQQFRVNDTWLHARHELRDGAIHYELTTYSAPKGPAAPADGKVPPVESLVPKSMQRAVLKRFDAK